MQNKRIILGIDPGSNFMGYSVLSVQGQQPELLCIGVEKFSALENQMEKLRAIFAFVDALIDQWHPIEMAIEEPFFGKNVQSMLKLGRAQGVIIAAALHKGLIVSGYEPRRVKQSVTGKGSASKEQVASMVCRILNIDQTKLGLDATDAAAIALCHLYSGSLTNTPKTSKNKSKWESFIKDNPDRIA